MYNECPHCNHGLIDFVKELKAIEESNKKAEVAYKNEMKAYQKAIDDKKARAASDVFVDCEFNVCFLLYVIEHMIHLFSFSPK
jgi:hypothetical protein